METAIATKRILFIDSIPVVFLTARRSLTEPDRLQELGVKGAIAKPFNSLTLVPQIANALGWNLETLN